jgi:hypothetical protein
MRKCFASFGCVLALSLVPALADQVTIDEATDEVSFPTTAVETVQFLGGPDGPVIMCNSLVADPFQVTHPGAGAGGKDVAALQTTLGLNVYGFGVQATAGYTGADDFTVPAGETWTLEDIEFYVYQSGSTSPSITQVHWAIVNTNPLGTFPATLTSSPVVNTMTNVMKAVDYNLTASTRPIQLAVVTVTPPMTLTAGQYWLEWNVSGTGASGPWQPPVTELGQVQKTTGPADAMQHVGSGFAPIIDNGTAAAPQDLIFCLTGQGGGPKPCPGDFDCDGDVDFDDIDPFVAVLGGGACKCPNPANCDPNGDGKTNFDDIDPFIGLVGKPCP